MSALALLALKALLATGALAVAGRFIASKIPAVQVHTGHERFDAVANIVGNAAEKVIKAELSGPLLTDVVSSAINGQGVRVPLTNSLPALKDQVLAQVGPAVQDSLKSLLGADGANDHVETALLVAAHDHALDMSAFVPTPPRTSEKTITLLPDPIPGGPSVVVAPKPGG